MASVPPCRPMAAVTTAVITPGKTRSHSAAHTPRRRARTTSAASRTTPVSVNPISAPCSPPLGDHKTKGGRQEDPLAEMDQRAPCLGFAPQGVAPPRQKPGHEQRLGRRPKPPRHHRPNRRMDQRHRRHPRDPDDQSAPLARLRAMDSQARKDLRESHTGDPSETCSSGHHATTCRPDMSPEPPRTATPRKTDAYRSLTCHRPA